MAYQSLYRRYRSQRFDEVLGQEHVTRALRNAVSEGRVAQGYLFSGPRGTGKTSTARILAKVLNCESPADGEPCTTCANCVAVQEGRHVDWLHELDAASNNGVDAMRDLLGRVSMGTSGNRKVYVLDEVHMLSAAASNALLKTLEEPPEHVVFVLATTEPEKVLATIRSRTQHFEFNLLPADVLADHVRHVIADAGIELPEGEVENAVDHVVKMGRGSARDTLSALDQVAAAGEVSAAGVPVDDLVDALGRSDAGAALVAVDAAVRSGRDPRVLAEALIDTLRNAFLHVMGAPASGLTDRAAERAKEISHTLGPAALTKALEAIGAAVVDMRHAPDPRIPLEVALVQVARPDAASDLDALVQRIEQLERAVARSGAEATEAAPSAPDAGPTPASRPPVTTAPKTRPTPARGPEAARAKLARHEASTKEPPAPAGATTEPPASRPTLGAVKRAREARPESSPDSSPAPVRPDVDATADGPATAPAALPPEEAPSDGVPSVEQLTAAWESSVLDGLRGRAKALFRLGHFVPGDGRSARFALPNEPHLKNCHDKLDEVRAALDAHFGRAIPLDLVVDDSEPPTSAGAEPGGTSSGSGSGVDAIDDEVDLDELTDAPDATTGGIAQLRDAFPGAELMEDQ